MAIAMTNEPFFRGIMYRSILEKNFIKNRKFMRKIRRKVGEKCGKTWKFLEGTRIPTQPRPWPSFGFQRGKFNL